MHQLCFSVAALSVFLGTVVAAGVHEWLDFSLTIENVQQGIWYFMVTPMIETLVVNSLLQQQLQLYWRRQSWLMIPWLASVGADRMAMWGAAVAFMCIHVIVAGGWVVLLWLLPGLVLSYLWRCAQSVLLLVGVHASWNISLWWWS